MYNKKLKDLEWNKN